jgi:tripartite-type tricarboxylate transporter receptor subunit TctC
MHMPHMVLKISVITALISGAGTVSAQSASADTGPAYPIKTLRVVTNAVGGGADFIARQIAQGIAPALSQQVIVDNRGNTSGEIVSKASPDGYTLLLNGGNFWLTPYLRDRVSYDPVKDFSTIVLVASTPIVLIANPSFPPRSVTQLIELARAKPGEINFASGGNGSSTHLPGEMLKIMANINLTHVPYKGAPLAMADLVSGQVQLLFSSLPGALPLIKAGKVRAIAVTSANRSGSAPEIPTVAEAGFPGYEAGQCFGLLAPASTPPQFIGKLNAETLQVLRIPEVVQAIGKQGYDALGGTPAEFESYLKSEIAKWAKVVRAADLRSD